MDKKDTHLIDSKSRKNVGPVAVTTPKRPQPPKTIKVASRPASTVTTVKVAVAASAKVDNLYALKARREWEQRMHARKTEGTVRPAKPPAELVRRKRPDVPASPSATSLDGTRVSTATSAAKVPGPVGPTVTSCAATVPVNRRTVVVRPTTIPPQPRRMSGNQTKPEVKRAAEGKQGVTILKIREPERVPATDLNIPVSLNVSAQNSAYTTTSQHSDGSPVPHKGSHTSSASRGQMTTTIPSSSIPMPNANGAPFMSLPPGYSLPDTHVPQVPAHPVAPPVAPPVVPPGPTYPRTLAFVYPVLQGAVQQGIISMQQCQQLTTLFSAKPLPPGDYIETRPIPTMHPATTGVSLTWPLHHGEDGHIITHGKPLGVMGSPGPPGHTPMQSPPPAARRPAPCNRDCGPTAPNERLVKRPSISADEEGDLVKAVRNALQKGGFDQSRFSGGSSQSLMNGRKLEMRGLPSSPLSSCGTPSDGSSVVSESVMIAPLADSPRPGRAVLYRTFSGDTVVIPPLNFRLLKK